MKYPWFLAIYYYLFDGTYPQDSTKIIQQRIRRQSQKYYIEQDQLREHETNRLVLHEANEEPILLQVHNESHFGIKKMISIIRNNFVCSNIDEKVKRIVKECQSCQFRARKKFKRNNPMQIVHTPHHPFRLVGCDAVGPMEATKAGNRYILTAVDHLTRWPIALAVPNINEETTIDFLFNQIVVPYGVPKFLLTDRGSNFVSEFTTTFLSRIGCRNVPTTAYRPQSNGLCERLNQTLVSTLAKICRENEDRYEWDRYINKALLVLRSVKNESTGYSPALLLYGYEMATPATWAAPLLGFAEGEYENAVVDRVKLVEEKLEAIRQDARSVSDEQKQKAKIAYDKTVTETKGFKLGDEVLLRDMTPSHKLADRWLGPFVIIKLNRNGTYYLQGKTNKVKLKAAVNGDMLTSFHAASKNLIPEISASHQVFRSWVSKTLSQ